MKMLLPLLLICLISCREPAKARPHATYPATGNSPMDTAADGPTVRNSIHIFTALCDNKYQGIVPVPAIMGNGQDPDNNLYWGWGYGIRTYFNRSKEWKLLSRLQPGYPVLERLIYQSTVSDFYLIADAYDGQAMKQCLQDYLKALSGNIKNAITVGKERIGLNGHARLLGFVGHNGLMDIKLEESYNRTDTIQRDGIVLACFSKSYFSPYFKAAGAYPLLWTSNLFGPEAYSLHEALSGYVRGESGPSIQSRAATIYAHYTKCSVTAAKRLLITGW
jgi:hypothetical protein